MVVSKKIAALTLVVVALAPAGILLLLTDRLPARETFPPGCTKAERALPGCHPTANRITSNTIALVTIIVSPLATLAVALVAVSATRSRQTEQLDAERDRLDAQLAHDRELKDLDELRSLLDEALNTADEVYDSLLHEVAAGKFDRARYAVLQRRREDLSNRLSVRLGLEHEIYQAWIDLVNLTMSQARRVPKLLELETADERVEAFNSVDDARLADVYAIKFQALTSTALPYIGARLHPEVSRARTPLRGGRETTAARARR